MNARHVLEGRPGYSTMTVASRGVFIISQGGGKRGGLIRPFTVQWGRNLVGGRTNPPFFLGAGSGGIGLYRRAS